MFHRELDVLHDSSSIARSMIKCTVTVTVCAGNKYNKKGEERTSYDEARGREILGDSWAIIAL